ncbi:putative endo-beta-1,4-glucanase B [Talaromyces atroroseus]|uniref:cellulase n=1 Tax=Talaromyces atroroseus TaxID=1441469 RepID=A0A225AT20_TALAT|nr:putative endo-beta-1,4-glucanase B [Talaromyces atroroseus]OKL56607.1 putative endo-beta-1,4-glucanase B [Talaromyces atroroseus]
MRVVVFSVFLSTAGFVIGTPTKEVKKRASSFESIQILIDAGLNIFRVPFLMERMIPNEMTGSLDTDYFDGYSEVIEYITNQGAYAVIDPHNFGRYYGNLITSTSDFEAFWATLATQFASNDKVIFDTNNEYYGFEESDVVALNQAAINGIRGVGATTQYIFAEGNQYTGAWTWTTYNTGMSNLTDPSNLLVYEMHQYLDSDGSGTSDACVSSTIGQERVEDATAWLIENNKTAILGEYAGGANSVCEEAVTGMLDYLADNSNVWLGALFWSAGPWWGSYIFSLEPPSGIAYEYYMPILETYA